VGVLELPNADDDRRAFSPMFVGVTTAFALLGTGETLTTGLVFVAETIRCLAFTVESCELCVDSRRRGVCTEGDFTSDFLPLFFCGVNDLPIGLNRKGDEDRREEID
jgi:hypothetical protein